MSEEPRPAADSRRRLTGLVTGAFVLVIVAVLILQGREAPSLPPGFTMTTGADSHGVRGTREGRRGSLEELIIASASEDDEFQASIAILPLENRTGDSVLDTLGRGMADELIARLSRIRGLKVISRQSVEELEGLDLTAAEVADTLDVDHLLQGTALSHDGRPRIQVRLVEMVGDTELWENDYSVDRANRRRAVEEIYDEVSVALVEEVPALSLRETPRTTESHGYAAYLAGSRLLNTRTRDGLIRAIDAFKSSIALDSSFALPYAGLSSAYALSVTYRYSIGVDAYGAAALALRVAEEAVRLGPDLAEAYAARGYISSVALAPAESVYEDFQRAMDLQPNAPNVPAWYANLLIREGYYDQALEQAQRAVELDPLSPARRTGLAYEALRARDYDLAIDQARTAQTLEAGVMLPRYIRALALILSNRPQDCLELDLGPHAGIRAICLHGTGRVGEAEAIADSLRIFIRTENRTDPDFTKVAPAGDLAAYLSWTGSPEQALPWVHRAYSLSPSGIDARVLESGVFDELLERPDLRREVAEIREGVWPRVQRELVDARIRLFERNR